ncbi:MAG: PAS domain S-box protein [Proteobacteria bacterium]|nr:PAS domain S-box protein [Pseudomonadota bacterium]
MTDTAFLGLIQNAALLLAVAFIFDIMISRHLGPRPLIQVATGTMLGVFGCVLILSPWTFMPGVVFDTRSVLLSISGLFFGAIPTVVAMAITAAFRLFLGGAAAWTGVSVILATGSLGIIWHLYRRQALAEISWHELYLFGLLAHVIMLALMFTLPWATALQVLAHISLPVLLIYPLATVLLGMLMVNRLRRERDATQLRSSEERMRLFFERQIVGMAITSPEKGWVQVNAELCRMLGYSREELSKVTWAELTHPEDLQADQEQFERLLAGEIDEYSMEKRFIRKDGAIVWADLSVGCVRFADKTVDYVLALLVEITDRKNAEESLKTNEERLRLALTASKQGLYDLNVQSGEAQVNQEYAAMLGYDPAQFQETNTKWIERLHPDDRETVAGAYRDYISGKTSEYRVEFRQRTKAGDWKWILSLGKVVEYDAEGRPLRMMGTHTDITGQKQFEEQLRESEGRFRIFFENAPAPYQSLNAEGHILEVNKAWLEMTGYTREEVMGHSIADFLTPASVTLLQGRLPVFLQKGFVHNAEFEYVGKNGEIINVNVDGRIGYRRDGTFKQTHCVLHNITERKQAETALRESERRYRQLFEANPQPMWVYDLETLQFLAVNDAAVAHYGYSREAFLSMTIKDIRPPEEVPRLLDNVARVDAGFDNSGFWRHLKKDGSIIEVEISSHTLIFAGRKAEMVLALDVTARRQAEAALRESEERYRTLVSNLPGLAYRCLNDEHWTMVFFSDEIERMAGYPAADFINNSVRSYAGIIHPDDRAMVDSAVQTGVDAHQPFEMEYRLHRADGATIWVHEKGQGIYDANGKLLWLDGVIIDITKHIQAEMEKRTLQAQLLQSQKMESVGRLAGGVAHDFNNMLQTIIGHSDLALAQIKPTDSLHEGLTEIRKAALRSADLTRQLLAFARKQPANPTILDLNDTVAGMLKMLQRLIGEDIDLAWLPGHSLWSLKMDPSQLDQILANLAVNARDAIADNGKITIETENIAFDTAYCADHPDCLPGKYLLLAVSDNGCGMDRETRDQIFEPFFTTKESGKGTGLGLATVYGIVRQNNGFVNVYSEPDQGTTFSIYLPAVTDEEAVSAPVKTSPVQELTTGTETVLVVEDEAALLSLAKTILERLGYTVLAAGTPMAAIELAQEYEGDIHLLITDVVMPEMNGRDLVQRITTIRPAIRCLYMSGYTADVIAHHGVLEKGIHFIQKPFSIGDLARTIRDTLEGETKNP